ncbi:MAG: sulfotransferase family protein, partial [Candidatus Heimdallarchaeota archaeon]
MKKKHWIITKEPLIGSSTSNIIRLLFENKFRVHIKYWLRLWFSLLLSILFMPSRNIERIFFNHKIRKTKITHDPIFIIGLWRSGTTYLNTLLALNDEFGYPRMGEAFTTHSSLAFPKLSDKLVSKFLPETRPFDNVKMSTDKPAELEHYLICYDSCSFTDGMIFPRNFEHYAKFATLDHKERKLRRWKKRYYFLIQKTTLKESGKQLLLKNPSDTGRIRVILDMFPKAKFIHLVRDPYENFASSIILHTKAREVFALQTWKEEEMKDSILKVHSRIYERYVEDLHLIPEENIIKLRYEVFLEDPLTTLKLIHKQLEINGFEETKEKYQEYIKEQANYKPNIHEISPAIIEKVNTFSSYAFD